MTPYEIDTKSWHYRLASWVGYRGNSRAYKQDICTYIKYVALALLLGTFLSSVLLISVIAMISAAVFLLMHGFPPAKDMPPFIGFGIIMFCVYLIVGFSWLFAVGIVHVIEWQKKRTAAKRGNEIAVKQPSFIVAAYRSLKDKYCIPLKFK